MKKKIFNIIVFFLITISSMSGETLKLTLNKAENLALNNNPEILQEVKRLEQVKSKTRLAYSSFLPSLNASGNRVLKEKLMTIEIPSFIPGQPPKKIEMDFTRNYQLTLQFTQPLFTGGKLIFGLNTAREMEKAEQSLLQAKRDEIKAKTKAMFYSIILLEKSLKIIQDGFELAIDTKNNIAESYKQGLVKKLDLLRAENRVREIEARKREIESNIFEAKNRFKNLLGINLDKKIIIIGKIKEKIYKIDLKILKKELIENNPILSSMKNKINAVKNSVKMAYSNFLPTVAIGGQYNFRGDSLGNFSNWDSYYSINLTLSYSLFKGFSKKYKLASAKAQKEEAEIGAMALKKNLLAELNNAVKKDSYLKAKIVLQKANYRNAKEEYDIASLSYKEGMISYTDLELIQNKYLTSQLNYFKAIYEYYSNIFKIESLVSKNIFK